MQISDMITRFGQEFVKPISEKMENGENPFCQKEIKETKDSEDIDFKVALGSMFFNSNIKN